MQTSAFGGRDSKQYNYVMDCTLLDRDDLRNLDPDEKEYD